MCLSLCDVHIMCAIHVQDVSLKDKTLNETMLNEVILTYSI